MNPPWWAWSRDGAAMHAWNLTEPEVRLAKATGSEHDTVCGRTMKIGERPVRPPSANAESNHCPYCWAILHPRATGVFLAELT